MQTSTSVPPVAVAPSQRSTHRKSGATQAKSLLRSLILNAVILVGAIIMLVPFLWMVGTSLKTLDQVFTFPPQWIPNPIVWENYPKALTVVPFGTWLFNSLRIAVLVTLGQLITCSLAGFTFARMRFPGRDVLFLVYIATMMIPSHVTIIPVFISMNDFGLVDTPWALILPGLTSAWGTFLFRQFFLSSPPELEEAAKIDGASYFRIYSQISLPLAKPVLATLGIFTFLGSWNDFLGALIFLQSKDMKTITVGLLQFRAEYQGMGNWPVMMAGVVISTLPVLIAFIIGQKYYVQGIALSGIKG